MTDYKTRLNNTKIIASALLSGEGEIVTAIEDGRISYHLIDRTRGKRERKAEARARVGTAVTNCGLDSHAPATNLESKDKK